MTLSEKFDTLDCKDEDDTLGKQKFKKNFVNDECFTHCKIDIDEKMKHKTLFASKYMVSEYKDNISRVGRIITDLNLHCHENCWATECNHPYAVDMSKHPKTKSSVTETPCGDQCARHVWKKPRTRHREMCATTKFGLKRAT